LTLPLAKLPVYKSFCAPGLNDGFAQLDDFDFSKAPQVPATKIHELAQGGYIERAEPIILIGDRGTGKTHLLTGLCVAACRQKRRVRFATAAALVAGS
jgi:DNA replication protein DnaC